MRVWQQVRMSGLAIAVLAVAFHEARASSLTGITVDPGTTIVVGYSSTYTANVTEDPFTVASYQWEYKCNTCGSGNYTTAVSTGNQLLLMHGGIGSMTIRCTVTWNGVSNPNLSPNPPPPESKTVDVTIIGPDTIKLDQGSGEVTPWNTPVSLYFRPYAQGKILGPYVSVTPEENVYRNGGWSGWTPASPDFRWRSDVAAIEDVKKRGWDPPVGPVPPPLLVPNPVDTIQHQIRITIPKCCGTQSERLTCGIWTEKTNRTDDDWHFTIDVTGGPD